MNTSREDILNRIDIAGSNMSPVAVMRNYAMAPTRSREEILDLFENRILDYKATLVRTHDVPSAIANLIEIYDLKSVVIPPGLEKGWSSGLVDNDLSASDLDKIDAVITFSEVGIAITGTIVLNHSRTNQGRRAISLVPDTHICVVAADKVVETVVEAVRMLSPFDHQTWISGPSATSDIELERVEGVHGPRNLHVILAL